MDTLTRRFLRSVTTEELLAEAWRRIGALRAAGCLEDAENLERQVLRLTQARQRRRRTVALDSSLDKGSARKRHKARRRAANESENGAE